MLVLDLVSESCAGEKHSPSGRTSGSSGLPKGLWCGKDSLPSVGRLTRCQAVDDGDEAGHKVLIPHHLSYTWRLQTQT